MGAEVPGVGKNVTRLPTARKRPVRNCVALLDGSEGNVVGTGAPSRLDLPPKRVLAAAERAELNEVVVIGFDADGEFYFASSQADGGDVLWLLEMAKKKLLEVGD